MPYFRLPESSVRRYCDDLFVRYGFSAEESRFISDVLITADLYGIESHGIQRLIRYHDGIEDGSILPAAEFEILFETKLSAVMDANMCMGQVVSKAATELAIKKAKEHGFGAVAVRRSNHYGIAGYYAAMMAKQGLAGMCFTNTEAIAIPTFGRNAMLGTNPISFAMPAEPYMFIYDAATTVVPRGKLEVATKKGQPLPAGWAVDEKGLDCTDAGRVVNNIINRAGGGILPLGGSSTETGSHKGYGLGLLVEIATSVFAGGVTSNHVGHCGNGETSETFFAIDYGMFGDKRDIENRLSTLLAELRASAKAEGHDRIYTHGEKEAESKAEKLKNGIPANEKTISEMRMIAKTVGMDFDDYFNGSF